MSFHQIFLIEKHLYRVFIIRIFRDAVKWADENPQEDLINANKVYSWLKDNLPNWVESYKEDAIIEQLQKSCCK